MKIVLSLDECLSDRGTHVENLNPGRFEVNPPGSMNSPQQLDITELQAKAGEGNSDAQTILGHAYFYGLSVDVDKIEAIKWYTLAANADVLEAQFALGLVYGLGDGVSKDIQQATDWFSKAAFQKNGAAHRELGKIVIDSLSPPASYEQAFFWYTLGEHYGDAEAAKLISTILPMLDKKQIEDISLQVGNRIEEDAGRPSWASNT